MSVSCGRSMNFVVLKSGFVYTWGKGDHIKPKFEDYKLSSIPSLLIEDKSIVYISCGVSHAIALDSKGKIYGWGEGSHGCLGLGDGKKRIGVTSITHFDELRVVDVACGDKFTVVIAMALKKEDKVKIS
jgi:alpha-tubulin suppressor-like RCC1 family protein